MAKYLRILKKYGYKLNDKLGVFLYLQLNLNIFFLKWKQLLLKFEDNKKFNKYKYVYRNYINE